MKILLPIAANRSKLLAVISRRDFFGEMAFLDNESRSADAVAASEVHLYIFSRKKFEAVAARHPGLPGIIFERLARVLAARVRQTDHQLRELE